MPNSLTSNRWVRRDKIFGMTEKDVRSGRYNSIFALVQSALTKTARTISAAMYVDYDVIDEKNADKIKQSTGLDLSGYTRTLTAQAILHSLNFHGMGGIRLTQFLNQIPLVREDFELLPKILNNPDSITLEEKKGPNDEDRIISRKQVGNEYVVVEEARPKKGLKKLVVITMWKEKPGTPLTTSETLLSPRQAGDAPELINNIAQNDENVNNNKSHVQTQHDTQLKSRR